jgi:hypothetical protein
LEVLRGQIPDEVRDLTISLLTNERQGLKQLEGAVTFMANHVSSKDAGQLDRRRRELEREILEIRGLIQNLDNEIQAWATKQLSPVPAILVGSDGMVAWQVAKLVAQEREKHKWIEDSLGPDERHSPRFTDQDIAAARIARCEVGADLRYLGVDIPSPSSLPDHATLCALHEDLRLHDLARAAEAQRLPLMSMQCANALARAEELVKGMRDVRNYLWVLNAHCWFRPIYEAWLAKGLKANECGPIVRLAEDMLKLVPLQQACLTVPATVPPLGEHRDEVTEAVRRASQGHRAFSLLSLGQGEAKGLFQQIRLSRKPPSTSDAWGSYSVIWNTKPS